MEELLKMILKNLLPLNQELLKKTNLIKPEAEQASNNQIKAQITGVSVASPKTRKFARELGVDINKVVGSEKDGRVVEDDIKKFVSSTPKNINEITENNSNKIKNKFEHSDFGVIEVKDIPRVKKLASKYLINSWTTIPHVTNHDEADITEMENFRGSLTDNYTGEKMKITPLAFIIKALVISLKKFPSFNSSIEELKLGNFFKDATNAFIINAKGVILIFSPV